MPEPNRKLRVFLCHTSQDKPIVRELYERLNAESWIDPWLDEENILSKFSISRRIEQGDLIQAGPISIGNLRIN